jgi:pimeloyl-ACP methyl ester carboxylesterase
MGTQHSTKVNRLKNYRLRLLVTVLFFLTTGGSAFAGNIMYSVADTAVRSGYAPVDGLKLYYEIHGAGEPLILLHGGVGSGEMFAPILPALAKNRQVIAVDLQAHGRTADIDRPLSFEAMADDIAALMKYLSIKQADVMGYSLGGGVALQVAIRYPELVRKLVVVSAPYKRDGWYPELLAGQAQMGPAVAEAMKPTPLYALYARLAPRVEDWPKLITKLGELLKKPYDWSAEVKTIKSPTLIVAGDADGISIVHISEFFALLGGGLHDAGWDGSNRPVNRLAILPGTIHYNMFISPALVPAVTPFLDEPMPGIK